MDPLVPQWLSIAGTVVAITIMGGLLGTDNALVLAVMVRHLPAAHQRRALRYGILGAFAFRFAAVLLTTAILDLWQFQVAGGNYLLHLAVSHLPARDRDRASTNRT